MQAQAYTGIFMVWDTSLFFLFLSLRHLFLPLNDTQPEHRSSQSEFRSPQPNRRSPNLSIDHSLSPIERMSVSSESDELHFSLGHRNEPHFSLAHRDEPHFGLAHPRWAAL